MPIPKVVTDAFKISDEAALLQLCRDKKKDADEYFPREGGIKMGRDHKISNDYSVLRIDNKNYLVAPKESYLGKGGFGQVKLAICIDNDPPDFTQLYAIKRETTNFEYQQRESEIAQALGVMVGKKSQRPSSTTKLDTQKTPITEKYYSVMHYLGTELFTLLEQGVLTQVQKTEIAIQTALQLNTLHQQYVHRDIKPENILVDLTSNPLVVRIIDYGFSQKNEVINKDTARRGTNSYLPGSSVQNNHWVLNKEAYIKRALLLKDLKNLDIFALKKTICNRINPALIQIYDLKGKHFILGSMLDTTDEEAACRREDTTEQLAAALICYQLDIGLAQPLTNEQSQQVINLYQLGKTKNEIKETIYTFYPKGVAEAFEIYCQLNQFENKEFNISKQLYSYIIDLYQHHYNDPHLKERITLLFIFEKQGEALDEVLALNPVDMEHLIKTYNSHENIQEELIRVKVDKISANHHLSFDREQINQQTSTKFLQILDSAHLSESQKQAEMISAYFGITNPPHNANWISSNATTIINLYQSGALEKSFPNSHTASNERWECQKNNIIAHMVLSAYNGDKQYTPPTDISEKNADKLTAFYSKYLEEQSYYSNTKFNDFNQRIKLQSYCLTTLNQVLETDFISKMTPQRVEHLNAYCVKLEQDRGVSLAEKQQLLSAEIQTAKEAVDSIINKAQDIAAKLNLKVDKAALTEKDSAAIITNYEKRDLTKTPDVSESISMYLNFDGESEREWLKSSEGRFMSKMNLGRRDLSYQESRQNVCGFMLAGIYGKELGIESRLLALTSNVNAYLTNLYDTHREIFEQQMPSTHESLQTELKIRAQASIICINEFEDNMENLARIPDWSVAQCQALIDGYKEKTTAEAKKIFTQHMIFKTTVQALKQTCNAEPPHQNDDVSSSQNNNTPH